MLLKRDWHLPGGIVCSDYPTKERDCGRSLKWMCVYCGKQYAQMVAWKDDRLQPYFFRGACCPDCFHKSNRWGLAGSLEDISLVTWQVPLPVALYQLWVELAFAEHPEHPHNKVYYV